MDAVKLTSTMYGVINPLEPFNHGINRLDHVFIQPYIHGQG